MDNNTVSSPPQNTSSLSEKVPKSGDNSLMNVTQKSASDPAKDKPSPDTFIASKADSSEIAKNEIPTDVLQLLSGDDAVFEDTFQELKENEALNVDKYFSDIESSDDSRAYEIKPQSEATPGDKTIEAELTSEIENIEKKVEEVLELEPVDSDEESFVDSPLVKERKAFVTRDCEDESRETGEITSSSYIEEDSVGQDSSSTKGIEKPKGGKEDATAEDVSQCNPESTSDTVEDTVDDDNEVTLSSLQFDEEEYLASALEAVLGSETSSRSPAIKETESKEEIGIKSTEQKSDSDEKKETPIEKAIEQAEEENDSVESDKVKEPVEKSPITSTEANPKDGKEDTPAVPENVAKDSLDEPQEETETEKPVDHGDEAKEESEEGPKPKEEENLHDNEESQAKTEEVEKSESAPENQQSVNPSDEAPEEPLKETMKLDDVPDNREVIEENEKMETDAPIEQTNEAPQTKEEKPEQEPEPAKEATEFQVDVATPEVIEKPITDTQAQEEQHSGDLKEPTPKEDLATNKDPQEPPSDENSSQVEPEIKLKPPVIEPVAEPSQIEPEKSLKSTNRDIDMEEKEEMKRPPTPEDIEMLELPQTNETAAKQSRMNQQSEDTNDVPSEDEDESLLVIDTTYKEPNETEDVEMDSETEQTLTSAQTSDSGSEESLEVFYDKKCVNYECMHKNKRFFRVTLFVLNFYKIARKKKPQFVCEECFDQAVQAYEGMCKTLKQVQPLYTNPSFKAQELVEIIESSDEEEDESSPDKTEEDENTFPKDCIALLEAELEGTIRKVMQDVNIQNQLSWTKQVLHGRLSVLEEDSRFVGEQLRCLQRKADEMHNTLYQCPKIKIRQLTPLDLNSGRTYNPESEMTIPPLGEIVRESIQLNETYYAVKNKAIASWVPCKVMEEIDAYPSNIKHYKIKFLKSKYPMLKTLSAKHMAFFNPPKVRLPIGTRVIAYFDASSLSRGKEKMLIPSAFYPGIIAEPLKNSNQFRYLVFYDDGYFQYVGHKDVRLVCFSSENVWEDVHHQSRDFIHNYLTQYAVNRPMVQTQKGQSMLVDYNGKWVYARVVDVDCSLVQMLFEGQNRSEWIYRGSTRLGPVYKETNNLSQKTQLTMSRISRRTEPFIRYSNGDETTAANQGQDYQQQPSRPGEVRSVAKKSVSRPDGSTQQQPIPIVRHLNNSTIFVDDDNKPKGKVVYYTARKNLPPRPYEPHICSPTCLYTITHNLQYYSPLAKPLLSGWERQVFRQKSKKFIVYRGPCGKRMRSMEELHRYLRVTENDLNVDNFDFSPETNCLAEYVIESCIVQKKDISNGKEKMPIPCVNYYDNTMPPDCIYSSERIPTDGVPLNLDPNFLVGCDCEDDCSDKARCSCWQLTYAGAKYGMPNVPHEMVGYQYKRLYEHVPTGIYECNSRCKCKSNCVNRVVQQPLQSKLQVFKTSNRGWGLRCINDVPRGSFICVYAGHLLTEQKANEGGLDAGDEYFAELDYIEVAEQIKEGYESDIPEIEEEEFQELYDPEKEDDDDEFVVPNDPQKNKAFSTRLRTRRTNKNSTDAEHDSQERQVINFEPNKTMGQPMTDHSIEKPSIRKLYGKDEACYIMDAKVTGNLGRYFNHSCSPNLFVQNVFVDTHDLRFPWVAFFAFTHIRAGTELTWNYNYEVGVVPGKVLYCQCGAPNCRQRLL